MGINCIRQLTEGSADILVLTTCPGFKRFDIMAELEAIQRKTAKEKQVELAGIAAEFRGPGSAEAALQKGYWGWDNVHLGTNGHKLTSELVRKMICQPR